MKTFARSAALLLAFLAVAPVARAQDDLPGAVVTSLQPLASDQESLLKKFAEENLARLTSDKPADVRRGRSALLKPLGDPSVSVSFRLAYSRVMVEPLAALAASDKDPVAVSALRVLGDLSTDSAVAPIEKALSSPRPAVRLAASSALGRVLETASIRTPALTADRGVRLIASLGERLATESEPLVADAIARALVMGLASPQQGLEAVPSAAMSRLSSVVGTRVQGARATAAEGAADASLTHTLILRAGEGLRTALADRPQAFQAQAIKDAAGFTGDVLALQRRRLAGADIPAILPRDDDEATEEAKKAQRERPAVQVATAESVLYFARQALAPVAERPSIPSTNLAQFIRAATTEQDARFDTSALDLIGPAGVLVRAPFELPASRFGK